MSPVNLLSTAASSRGSELQRSDRFALAYIRAAVVVKTEGGLAVSQDVGDRAIRLASIEHCRRGVVPELTEGYWRCPASRDPAVLQPLRTHRNHRIDATGKDVRVTNRLSPQQFAPPGPLVTEGRNGSVSQR